MTIKGLLDRVKTLNIEMAIPVIVKQTSYEIEVLNKQQLYNHGVGNDGNKLRNYKSASYAREKNYTNPRPGLGKPDLFVTGAFYQGFNVNVTRSTFEVNSTNSKSARLNELYEKQVFGLTKDNIKVYALGVFYTEFQKYVTLKTGLVFK